jgi:hypothetical protein
MKTKTTTTTTQQDVKTTTRSNEMGLGVWCIHLPAQRYIFVPSTSTLADPDLIQFFSTI